MGVIKEIMERLQKLEEEEAELLTYECILELHNMTTNQLEAIYKNGKRKVKLDSDPKVYKAMSRMTTSQLHAIFGGG